MLLAIDIGNSHTVVGLFKDDQLVGHWRLQSDRNQTADELTIHLHGLFSMIRITPGEVTGISLASVVPSLQTTWLSCCRDIFSHTLKTVVVSAESVKDSIRIETDHPAEVGADRLVNAIAAWEQYRSRLIIIDFGTAITFDCVSAAGAYLGGVILPGITIALDALSSRTAKLPRIDISARPAAVIGTNTVHAMTSGILHGYGSLVDGLVHRIKQEMGDTTDGFKVIATGGMAALIAPYAATIEDVDTMLTLKGLCLLFSRCPHHA